MTKVRTPILILLTCALGCERDLLLKAGDSGVSEEIADASADAGSAADAEAVADAGPVPRGSSWAKSLAELGDSTSVAIDSRGNVLVGGMFAGTVDFGSGPRTPPGMPNVNFWSPYVAKYSPDGALVWVLTFQGFTLNQDGRGVRLAVTPDDGVVLSGAYHGALDLGKGPLPFDGDSFDLFLAKFDRDGTPLWSRGFPAPAYQGPSDVVADSQGSIWLTGVFKGSVDLGTGPLVQRPSAHGGDFFVAKFGADGQTLLATRFGGDGDDSSYGLGLAPDDGVVVVGGFSAELDLGAAGKLTAADGFAYDGFVLRLGPTGEVRWGKSIGGDANRKVATAAAFDHQGEVLVSGVFAGSLSSLGEPALVSSGPGMESFAVKLSGEGEPRWKVGLGDVVSSTALIRRPFAVDALDRLHYWTRNDPEPVLRRTLLGPDGAILMEDARTSGAQVASVAVSDDAYVLCGTAQGSLGFEVPESPANGRLFVARILR